MLKKKKKVVAVSGGFDPLHIGHLKLLEKARALGDELIVILNNDNWMKTKKGYVFMPEKERAKILQAIRFVDKVVITKHKPNDKDRSVSRVLEEIRPDIFANDGDVVSNDIAELGVCKKIKCKVMSNISKQGKVQSSSWLLQSFYDLKKKIDENKK